VADSYKHTSLLRRFKTYNCKSFIKLVRFPPDNFVPKTVKLFTAVIDTGLQ
jgi:hypothetical protein